MQTDTPDYTVDEWGYWRCKHRVTAIRRRTRKNGVCAFCEQCLICGSELRAVAKGSPAVLALTKITPFDDGLQDAWYARGEAMRAERQRKAEEERAAAQVMWWRDYNEYLKSPAWRKKAAIVMDRAPAGLCEGCGVNLAVQVHHLSYEHVGNELLWELRAVCFACHQRIHADKDIRHD